MKKSGIILAALLVGLVFSGAAFAADREQYHINELTLGDPAVLLTATAAELNATEARLDALEGGSTVGTVLPGYIIVGNSSSQGVDVAVSGDLSITTSGVITLDDDTVGTAEMADADHGDIAWTGGVASLDDDTVGTSEMADADHGDVTWASGVASLDANVVGTAEMDSALVSTSLSGVTNFDITIVNGVITVFTSN